MPRRTLLDRALSFAADVVRPLNHGIGDGASVEADADYVLQIVRDYLRQLSTVNIPVAGSSLLELGPGSNFGAPLILASLGAKVAVADRFLASWRPDYHPAFYRALRAKWDGPASALDRVIAEDKYPESITLIARPAENLNARDDSFDCVFSNAVLEHVFDFEATCRELARVTKPGGFNLHQIDFRDHRDMDRPLEFLLLDSRSFRIRFALTRGQMGNRHRPDECSTMFKAAGFEIVSIEQNGHADPAYIESFLPRLRAAPSAYKDYTRSHLDIIGARFALAKRTGRLS